MNKQKSKHKQAGVTLLEALISIAIMGLVTAASFRIYTERAGDIKDQQVATEAKQVVEAARRYTMDNFATIQATATAATPFILSTATLVTNSYLPSSFSGTNAYGQTYQIKILEPAVNQLEGLVVTLGGLAIERKRTPSIAALVGAMGGYIPYAGDPGNCNATTVACGSFGGWRIGNTANYWTAGAANPGGGHLAMLLSFDSGVIADDFLYRNAVPGQPELNQMNTAIDMNNNNVSNVNTITGNAGVLAVTGDTNVTGDVALTEAAGQFKFAGGGYIDESGTNVRIRPQAGGDLIVNDAAGNAAGVQAEDVTLVAYGNKRLSRAMTFAALASPGDTVTKPTCVTGAPRIFLAPSQFAYSTTGSPIQAVQAWATDLGASWQVNLSIVSTAGSTPNHVATGNKVLVFTKCS